MNSVVLTTDLDIRTPAEEMANTLTHALGALGAVVALVMMILKAEGALAIVSASVFGGSMILLFTASAVYHAFAQTRARAVLKIIDHVSIYLLIAGSYTPFCMIALGGGLGWTVFGVVWAVAFFGALFKLRYAGRHPRLSIATYLVMGWLGVFTLGHAFPVIGTQGTIWLAAEGLAYSCGVPFYLWKSRMGSHTLWHIFVLAGAAAHVVLVYRFLL